MRARPRLCISLRNPINRKIQIWQNAPRFSIPCSPIRRSGNMEGGTLTPISAGPKSPRVVRDAKQQSVASLFGTLFGELHPDNISPKALTLTRCLISYYHKYLDAKGVLRLMRNELAGEQSNRFATADAQNRAVGMVRYAREWVAMRFESDFRGNRDILWRLYRIATHKTKNDALRDELNILKLLLIAKCPWVLEKVKGKLGVGCHKRRATHVGPRDASSPKSDTRLPTSRSHDRRTLSVPNVTVPVDPVTPPLGRVSLMKLDSRAIASHMIHVTFEALARVSPHDFYEKYEPGSGKPLNGLQLFIKRNEDTRAWVSSMILIQPNAKAQRNVAVKFLEVANFCRDAGNLQDCYAIMQAFVTYEVGRIRRLWHIPENIRMMAAQSEIMFSTDGNYKLYRAAVKSRLEARKLCIPYLGVWQRDITISNEANPLYTSDGSVNMEKLELEGEVLANVATCQARPPSATKHGPWTNEPLLHLLRELPHKEEEELRTLSELIRPRKTNDESSGSSAISDNSSNWSSTDKEAQIGSARGDDTSNRSDDYVDL